MGSDGAEVKMYRMTDEDLRTVRRIVRYMYGRELCDFFLDDIVGETCLKLTMWYDPEVPGADIAASTWNIARKAYQKLERLQNRKHKKIVVYLDEPEKFIKESQDDVDLRLSVEILMSRLEKYVRTPRQHSTLLMRVQGFSYREIGEKMGFHWREVSTHLRRAREKIMKYEQLNLYL